MRVCDALWRNAGWSRHVARIPDFAALHPGYKRDYVRLTTDPSAQ